MHRIALLISLSLIGLFVANGKLQEDPVDADSSPIRAAYGPAPEQFGTLYLPGEPDNRPVIVLIHGGFWKDQYGEDLMVPLAEDLVERNYAVWNLEYRRVGQSAGGHLDTLGDIAAGIDYLAVLSERHNLDTERIGVVGHSAGGHLALWAGSRHLLPVDSVGSAPVISPAVVVGQAAVTDLASAAALDLGNQAVQNFLGGSPDDTSAAYALAQPAIGATQTILVHGTADDIVPLSQSTKFSESALLIEVEAEDHFTVIDPRSESWFRTQSELASILEPAGQSEP